MRQFKKKFGTPKSARVSLIKFGFDFHLVSKRRTFIALIFWNGSGIGAEVELEWESEWHISGSGIGVGAAESIKTNFGPSKI